MNTLLLSIYVDLSVMEFHFVYKKYKQMLIHKIQKIHYAINKCECLYVGAFMSTEVELFTRRLNYAFEHSNIKTKAEFASLLGISPQYLNKLLKGEGKSLPPADITYKMAEVLKFPFIELITGNSVPVAAYEDDEALADGMIAIEQYHVSIAAGSDAPEASYEEEHDSRPVWYHRSFFDNLGINPKNCRRFVVSGDSMAPLINDGDTVLIDCTPSQKLIDGEIYGFWQAQNGLRVKRIYIPMGGGITIHSDNPRYEDEYYDDSESCNFRLIGRVLERSGSVV